MTKPIHILCSNFQEIGRREVRETKLCCGDKSSENAFCFFGTVLHPFDGWRQKSAW